ncbi:hypothetical protein [Planotetraspora sp. GP83]|uniref:hypothetical protein n=1 Tax=Planotetraspora sp. GP83 TaxID=3156264 RepID=UPI0035193424
MGPSIGGLLIAGFGWRAIFLVGVPLGLLTLALTMRVLPAPPHPLRVPHAAVSTSRTPSG